MPREGKHHLPHIKRAALLFCFGHHVNIRPAPLLDGAWLSVLRRQQRLWYCSLWYCSRRRRLYERIRRLTRSWLGRLVSDDEISSDGAFAPEAPYALRGGVVPHEALEGMEVEQLEIPRYA